MSGRRQRIRDPLHNLIEFGSDEFEQALWRVVETNTFQRLRRIKQLGLSELVYPGATHTRFAHSIGVFHTARRLIKLAERHFGERGTANAKHALAAALVHDVGHGPFSHAFEEVGKRLKLPLVADHERMSDLLIRDGEIDEALRPLGSGFANDVARVIGEEPKTIYGAVVSSQFDADRLDYMRRDRLMTGTQHGAIDFEWLLANLEVGRMAGGVDDAQVGDVETFVLGSKAIYAAETYVLALFQLYPTVYFHKTTRGAEKILIEILCRVIKLVRQSSLCRTGLPKNHPLISFAKEPGEYQRILELDDAVVWGALGLLSEAEDEAVRKFAQRLRARKLLKCVDVRLRLQAKLGEGSAPSAIEEACQGIEEKVLDWSEDNEDPFPRIIVDKAVRQPYRRVQESKGPLNQIRIKTAADAHVDIVTRSSVVAAIPAFKLFRLYFCKDDTEAIKFVDQIIDAEGRDASNQ